MLQVRPDQAEYRGTEKDAGNQLAHDGRLPDALHRLAHEPTADKQRNYLTQKYDFRGAGCGFVGCQQRKGSRPSITKSASTAPNPRLLIDTLGYLKLMCQRKAAAIAAALKTAY